MIFIDTGAFVARYVERDQHHATATVFWDNLLRTNEPCFTSTLVLSETFTLLARRADYRFAARQARTLYTSNVLQILRPDSGDETGAILLFEKYAAQKVSYCDCVSFGLMQRYRIQDVFTFDGDFAIAGFNVRP